MNKNWSYKKADAEKVEEIVKSLGVSPVVATLLVNRDIASVKEAERFLNPDLSRMHNPFLLPDMEKAVVRVRQSINNREKILIYGDRDVDGVTSVSILVRTLKGLGADVVWAIPSTEGHGVHPSILERYAADGVKLVITVDLGTSAVEAVDYAKSVGMDVVITDHHLPPETLPKAVAIVNPNLKHSTYPMKDLAGCLTAFKFAYALMFSYNRTFNQEFVVLDFETTGLSPANDEIVEVAAIRVRNFVPVGEFHSLIKPSRTIPRESIAVHGITDAMVADAPVLRDVLPGLLDFIGDRTLVAHNARFDQSFLLQAARRILGRDVSNAFLDTLSLSRENFEFKSHALGDLARNLKIDLSQAHRAMSDCLATLCVFQRIEEQRDPRLQFFLEDQMDLVTLGTIADIVPLVGENRIIVKHGLPRLLTTRKIGLRKLLQESGIPVRSGPEPLKPEEIPTAKEISWGVTPLLNAAGRLNKADVAARLLITDSEAEASRLVSEIVGLNEDRKSLQKVNLEKFFALVKEQCDLDNDKLLFVSAEGLGHGVTGIVASQMVRQYQRPVVLLIVQNGEAMGSSRSIPGFNIVEALEHCKDLLVKYGGHPAAAGLTLETSNLGPLKERLKKYAETRMAGASVSGDLEIDLELPIDSISSQLIAEIGKLEPFGEGNPAPLFVSRGVQVSEQSLIGSQKNHLRLRLVQKDKSVGAIGWSMGDWGPRIGRGTRLDLAYQIEMDRWNGNNVPRLLLSDVNVAEA